jgi:carboxyl-terminal processing protease
LIVEQKVENLIGGFVNKKTFFVSITLVTIALLLSGYLSSGSEKDTGRILSQLISSGLENWHYSEKKIDDSFSIKAFEEFIKSLDYNKRFLLKSDFEEFSKYKYLIDDQFLKGDTEFLEIAIRRLLQRIRAAKGFYEEILQKPFNFSLDETLETDSEERDYCSSLTELKEYWRKNLKYRTLLRYVNYLETDKETKDKKLLEEKARKAVAKSLKHMFNRIEQTYQKDSLSIYFNSLINVYDPHSTYMPPLEKETFDLEMSGSFEGIGALLTEEAGYIKVSSIVPGGPSWKQRDLQPADLIIRVGQGEEEPVDVIGMRLQDAVKMIRGKKGTLVKLTVKKPDGQIVVIPIVRDVVVVEDTFAKSAILINESPQKKFGYIYLPRFYNDFSLRGGRNATEDVRKELIKLKKKDVSGVILDLRRNTGGALDDAVKLSGLFIPQGPIVQTKDRRDGQRVLKDEDPEIVYDGPLVVMINSLSASASEILAAALQDYKRAVIIGGDQSFGKGTVQVLINLDSLFPRKKKEKNTLGAITMTIQKFYRIDGSSIQQKGVVPDIVLPDLYSSFEIGERHLENSLNHDVIPSASFHTWDHNFPQIEILSRLSSSRIKNNPRFTLLANYISRVKKRSDNTIVTLNLEKMQKQQAILRNQTKEFNKSQEKLCNIKVIPSQEIMKKSSERLYKIEKEREKEWFLRIKKDYSLKEAMTVLSDIIKIT